ncbi:phosphatidate cytidylyltransferase [Campylobacterota bacterium]|nr:phosphatidate cytidylyltransferase [Campylobacterota bacterium]
MGFIERIKSDKMRIATGLALLAVVLIVGFFNNIWVIGAFLSVVFVVALHEAIALYDLRDRTSLYIVAIVLWAAALFYPYPLELLFVALLICAASAAFSKANDLRSALVILYPTAPMVFLFLLYREFGIGAFVWLVVAVIACDVGAYYAGKLLGKTPFSPSSPSKTLEGVVGGVTAGTVLGTMAGLQFDFGFWATAAISLAVSVGSVFGDLFESYLKRQAGVKDSGHILPGHGGALDRIDGYLFAAVVLLVSFHLFSWQ